MEVEPALPDEDDGEFNSSASHGCGFRCSDDDQNDRRSQRRREICWQGCGRPAAICICPFLPPSPIPTSTRLVVLHHPHELRGNKLATLPALSRSLLLFESVRGRRLRHGCSPLLDSLSLSPSPSSPVLFLFPSLCSSRSAQDLARWAADTPLAARSEPVLVVFDATWSHAREMVAASLPFLSRFALQVEIGGGCDLGLEGASTFESDLVLRKEPWSGCVSTIEAVARALRVLEPDNRGAAIEEMLLAVLRAMVAFQARHLKPTRPRLRMRKKGQEQGECSPSV
ncbi:hypothetical protein AXF42_Ash017354 [Apostasia shenzhenica]|uniref:tRNA-uridine aminocarboxypropyltransferase n=1 Tax=Apostasia shenzhenica TaxID=1088818 RepID=A0A2I0BDF0_9ASPA|nr:hypothetical protein AXF42_Ash017354 [Apostasia shenzhenica]